MKYVSAIVLAAALANPLILNAGEPGPEKTVEAYFAAFKSGDLAAVSANMHPEELAKFKKMMLPLIREGIESVDDKSDEEDILAVRLFTKDSSLAEIDEESAQDFFTRFMHWITALNPTMGDSMAVARTHVIGVVPEGDLAHVVYRLNIDVYGSAMSQVSVMTARQYEGAWKLLLTAEIEGMAQMLQMNLDDRTGDH